MSAAEILIIDDRSTGTLRASLGTEWRRVSDHVMGGVSQGWVTTAVLDGEPCIQLRGDVRLDNNGGFIQAALDFSLDGTVDLSAYRGIALRVRGNGERYNLHLRTADTRLPWQSYRQSFTAGAIWRDVDFPFTEFTAYRIRRRLDTSRLRRLGVVAIGRVFHADLCVAGVWAYH